MYETNHQVRRPAAGPGAAVRRVVLESAGLFDILADAGMLVLHSAYIVTRQGEGILLSGPSGIGKSTQAALWQRYGAAQTVNGDRALVRPDTGTVSGVMYAGTSGICRNVTAPLRAAGLLHQAPESRVTDIRPQEAFARVLSQCAYHQWDPASAARMTELAARLVTNVPVRQLDCRAEEQQRRGAGRSIKEDLNGIQQHGAPAVIVPARQGLPVRNAPGREF